MAMTTPPSSNPSPSDASRERDEAAPVHRSRTSARFALFWVLLVVLSFALTLAILFRAATAIS